MKIIYGQFHQSNLVYRNSIGKCDVFLRPNLYGVPGFTNLSNIPVQNLYEFNIIFLGITQLICWDSDIKLPKWCYMRLDSQKIEYFERPSKFFAEPQLPLEDQKMPQWDGKSRGHLNHCGSCKNSIDAEASMSQVNLVPQNSKLNSGVWNILEQKIKKYAVKNKLIAHICTIPTYKKVDGLFVLDHMCKVLFYEKKGEALLELQCFILFDDSNDKSKVRKTHLSDVENFTQLNFLSDETKARLSPEDLDLHKKRKIMFDSY